jgi:hypothetical protein
MSVLLACSHSATNGNGSDGGSGSGGGTPDACVGRGCDVTACRAMGKSETTVTGTVFAPNGTLPLYGINVYVPATDPGPLTTGQTCSRCADPLPGNPVVQTITNEHGQFSLIGVPSGDAIPIVITSGKWRKIITLPHVDGCTATALPTTLTALPRNRSEGDMPQIAITTGGADSFECLVRKLGVDDSEITTNTGGGRVHLYAGSGGQDQFKTGFAGGSGQTFGPATSLWSDAANLKTYDITFFSCEGFQDPEHKPQASMDNIRAYADAGGRVFASHWQNIWLEGSKERNDEGFNQAPPQSWLTLGTWTNRDPSELDANTVAAIDERSNPKGVAFANWMLDTGGSTVRDQIALQNQPPDPTQNNVVLSTGRTSLDHSDPDRTERWVYVNLPPDQTNAAQHNATQNFQFTTPIEQTDVGQRCGKFVFSDMHVSGTSNTDLGGYPDSCGPSNDLTAQEKALAFMFFDIASCVGTLF